MTKSEYVETEFNLWRLSDYVERTSLPVSNSEAPEVDSIKISYC